MCAVVQVGGAVCAFYGKTALFTDCTFTVSARLVHVCLQIVVSLNSPVS